MKNALEILKQQFLQKQDTLFYKALFVSFLYEG